MVTDEKELVSFTSEYIARMLAILGDDIHLRVLENNRFVRNNAVLDGWALAADFLHAVRTGRLLNKALNIEYPAAAPPRLLPGGADLTFRVAPREEGEVAWHVYDFHRNAPKIEKLIQDRLLQPDYWFIPEVFNQGGFDCFQIMCKDNGTFFIRFVQVDRNMKHPLKVQ